MILPVQHCRNISKKDMVHNNSMPVIDVNPENYEVKVNGEVVTCEPIAVAPLAQRYFLF
jgi:urease subunit alpha